MAIINKYHEYIFKKISSVPMAILANGPSIKELESHVIGLKNRDILYVAINNRFTIEKNILNKINKKINIWCIFSPDEAERYRKDIYDFLLDDSSIALITTSSALSRILYLIYDSPMPNAHKICIIDEVAEQAFSRHSGISRPLYFVDGSLNTLFILLLYMLRIRKEDVYLFGCDGMANPKEFSGNRNNNTYYKQDSLSKERISVNNIYNDMLVFDDKWPSISEELLGSNIANIINVNLKSYYKSFPKINIQKAMMDLKKNSRTQPSGDTHSFSSTDQENLETHNNIINYININLINRTVGNFESRYKSDHEILCQKIETITNTTIGIKSDVLCPTVNDVVKQVKNKINNKAKLGVINKIKSKALMILLRVITNYIK